MNRAFDNGLHAAIAAGPPARFLALFGSQATGTAHAGSDIDVAWLPADTDISLGQELAFQAELTRMAGREVDLVRVDQTSTLCRMEIARHGILLAGDRSAFARFRAEAIAEFLDYEPAFRAASERFRRRLAAGGSSRR
ncbi:MAG: nucleotidyltransferase domain-containing protein [Planctomycetota bacterium]